MFYHHDCLEIINIKCIFVEITFPLLTRYISKDYHIFLFFPLGSFGNAVPSESWRRFLLHQYYYLHLRRLVGLCCCCTEIHTGCDLVRGWLSWCFA